MRVEGKVIAMTGMGQGIAETVAERFVAEGEIIGHFMRATFYRGTPDTVSQMSPCAGKTGEV